MSDRPTYLSLRLFQHIVRGDPSKVLESPNELMDNAVLPLLDRMPTDDIRTWLTDVYQVLNRPSPQDVATARNFEDAEERFVDVLSRGWNWDHPLLMNNLGKVGNDLGFKVPFLF